MKPENMRFFQLVRDFLTIYLPNQKSSSPNTIKAYKDALNFLLLYLKEAKRLSMMDISFDKITRKTLEDYLDWLEKERECSIPTRNHRLSCIRAFYKYAGGRDLTVTAYAIELENIPIKKSEKVQQLKFFEENALKVILAQPNISTKKEFVICSS